MEAYTELYRVSGNKDVLNCLKDILDIFEKNIFKKEKGCLDVFFDMNYKTIIELDSFGHDIEASWLMDRCAEVINEPLITQRIHNITDVLCEHVLNAGYDTEMGALYNEIEDGRIDKQYIWWVQAEAVIGFYNAWTRHPDKENYLHAADKTYKFITEKMVDPRCGEWYESILEDGTIDISKGMVHKWKCPYHTGRMYIEMINRL
jgi:mannose/cellobiose epimerase-like protein (N-acyl-D-glucosamine 2-epimerase family)